jgi:hypothetical protein
MVEGCVIQSYDFHKAAGGGDLNDIEGVRKHKASLMIEDVSSLWLGG